MSHLTLQESDLCRSLEDMDRMLLEVFQATPTTEMAVAFQEQWEGICHAVSNPTFQYSVELYTMANDVARRVAILATHFRSLLDVADDAGRVFRRNATDILDEAGSWCHAPTTLDSRTIIYTSCTPTKCSSTSDDRLQPLRTWFLDHIVNPYPNKEEKTRLCSEHGLTSKSVNNFFTNARRRSGWQAFLDEFAGGSKATLAVLVDAIESGAVSYTPPDEDTAIIIPTSAKEAFRSMRQSLAVHEAEDALLEAVEAERVRIEEDKRVLVSRGLLKPGAPLPRGKSARHGGRRSRQVSEQSERELTLATSSNLALPQQAHVEDRPLAVSTARPALPAATNLWLSTSATADSLPGDAEDQPLPPSEQNSLDSLFNGGLDFNIDDILASMELVSAEESRGRKRGRADGEDPTIAKRRRMENSEASPTSSSALRDCAGVAPSIHGANEDGNGPQRMGPSFDDGPGTSWWPSDATRPDARGSLSGVTMFNPSIPLLPLLDASEGTNERSHTPSTSSQDQPRIGGQQCLNMQTFTDFQTASWMTGPLPFDPQSEPQQPTEDEELMALLRALVSVDEPDRVGIEGVENVGHHEVDDEQSDSDEDQSGATSEITSSPTDEASDGRFFDERLAASAMNGHYGQGSSLSHAFDASTVGFGGFEAFTDRLCLIPSTDVAAKEPGTVNMDDRSLQHSVASLPSNIVRDQSGDDAEEDFAKHDATSSSFSVSSWSLDVVGEMHMSSKAFAPSANSAVSGLFSPRLTATLQAQTSTFSALATYEGASDAENGKPAHAVAAEAILPPTVGTTSHLLEGQSVTAKVAPPTWSLKPAMSNGPKRKRRTTART